MWQCSPDTRHDPQNKEIRGHKSSEHGDHREDRKDLSRERHSAVGNVHWLHVFKLPVADLPRNPWDDGNIWELFIGSVLRRVVLHEAE